MAQNKTSALPPVVKRILTIAYWVIFAISLVIVVIFVAFKLFIEEPEVGGSEVIVPPVTEVTPPPSTKDPSGTETQAPTTPQPVVLHRRDGVYTCLLVGTDDGNGNADTIMLGVFDTGNKTASLISIPRDTLVFMDEKDYKINAIYAYYGLPGLCEAVTDTLAIPVDFYVSVDLAAFVHIVDEIGGVWFTVPQDMEYSDPTQDLYIDLKAGYQLLDGENALDLMRFRSGYANQDLGRVQVQRSFLVAMVKQAISLSNVSKVTNLIEILSTYVETNMPLRNMVFFATEAIGMDLNTALTSTTLPSDWIYPALQLRDDEVLAIVNSLGIYEEEVPMEALHIRHK